MGLGKDKGLAEGCQRRVNGRGDRGIKERGRGMCSEALINNE